MGMIFYQGIFYIFFRGTAARNGASFGLKSTNVEGGRVSFADVCD